jgi:RsiW-degrading membrane proteinase PrsW (M82 family)
VSGPSGAAVSALVALVPVLLFLTGLQLMDSFKLVRHRAVLLALAAGGAAALACLMLHHWWFEATGLAPAQFSRYVAPVTEETTKALFVAAVIAGRRVGFLVDAAVTGFAVGAGFALVENLDYLRHTDGAPVLLWVVRGLGTAMLHGATMAIFAMVSKALSDRHPDWGWTVFVPGWAAAVVIHSAFNHVPLPPAAMTALLLIVLPLLVVAVYDRSERATREWVGAGLDLDLELLDLVVSEQAARTRIGRYLQALRERFPGPIVADMYCLLRLDLELSVQAKAVLLARREGVDVPADDDLRASLEELAYLQASIGRLGMLALKPLRMTSHRDHWHRHLLGGPDSA